MSPFLCNGIIIDSFHCLGRIPVSREVRNICVKFGTKLVEQFLRTIYGIFSGDVEFFGGKYLRIWLTCWALIVISERIFEESHLNGGRVGFGGTFEKDSAKIDEATFNYYFYSQNLVRERDNRQIIALHLDIPESQCIECPEPSWGGEIYKFILNHI